MRPNTIRLFNYHRTKRRLLYPAACADEANKEPTQDLEDIEDWIEIQKMDLPELSFPPAKDPSLNKVKGIEVEPQTLNGINSSPHRKLWENVMARELYGLDDNGTFL